MHSFKRSIEAPKPCSSTCSLQEIARKVYYYMNDAHILSSSVITKLLFTMMRRLICACAVQIFPYRYTVNSPAKIVHRQRVNAKHGAR